MNPIFLRLLYAEPPLDVVIPYNGGGATTKVQSTTKDNEPRTYDSCDEWENFDWNQLLDDAMLALNPGEILSISQIEFDRFVRLAGLPNVAARTLYALAFNPSEEVRKAVADNPKTPYSALRILVHDENPDVRFHIAENHNLPNHILEILTEDDNPYVSCRALKTLNRQRCTCGCACDSNRSRITDVEFSRKRAEARI